MPAPLKIEDFDLTPDEMKDLVQGAQRFLAPAADPADDDRATFPSVPPPELE